MKKAIFLILMSISLMMTSCNQQTLKSYNSTIVVAHRKLFQTSDNFFKYCAKYIGKPNSKKELLQLIAETKSRLNEDRKPVEALVPFTDHGLRKTMLEMYSNTQDAMDNFAANVDIITGSVTQTKAIILIDQEYAKLRELDQLLRELQVQYAYYNNGQLR